ncbi:MAG: ATP-binding protein [Pseudomonadota bacterium]
MSSSMRINDPAWRRLLRRIARIQVMLGIPLIVVLFILHLGLSSTSNMLIETQFNFYQSNSVLQKSALSMVQARRAVEIAIQKHDVDLMYHASDVLNASLGLLREGMWLAPGTRAQLLEPLNVAEQISTIEMLDSTINSAAASLAAHKPLPSMTSISDRLDVLYITFRELQVRHERTVFDVYTRLAVQQQRYEWAVRATLLLLLTLYGSLIWLYANQRRTVEELRQARDTAERATRAKSDFLAVMSHELRTPLNGVIGLADLLDRSRLDETQHEYVNLIRDSGNNLLRIIDDVLDFSSIEAERIPLIESPFDLRELTTQMIALLRTDIHEDVTLDVSFGDDLPLHILGDRTRYSQILANLLKNAIKFTHEGEVTLDIDITDRSELVIRVRDTGIGIAPEKIDAIYQPFSQADSSIMRTYGGAGLGLAITRRLVELMQGDITVRSVPGQGTEFMLHLPLKLPGPASTTAMPPSAVTDRSRQNLHILVVEDNPVNQMVTRRMLESLGHRVDIATDGREGVARARGDHYDLVLMDLQMPQMSGIEAAQEIRKAGGKAKIVALSANVLPEHQAAAEAVGMNSFLAKPARLVDLEHLLQSLFPAENASTTAANQPGSSAPIQNQTK